MTTDRPERRFPLGGALVALLAWFGGMAGAALFVQPRAVTVFGPQGAVIEAAVALGGDLLDAGAAHVTTTTSGPGFVRQLYARGAWLVWPAFRSGCSGQLQANAGPRPSA